MELLFENPDLITDDYCVIGYRGCSLGLLPNDLLLRSDKLNKYVVAKPVEYEVDTYMVTEVIELFD